MGSVKRITLSDFNQLLQEQGKNADIVQFLADESNRFIVVPDPGEATYIQRMRDPKPKVLLPRKFTQPVMIKNVHFAVHVDWSDRRFEDGLTLIGCRFRYGLCLRDMHVIGRCVITGCEVRDTARHWIDWRRLRCEGDLDLSGMTAQHPIDLYNARIGDDLRLDGVHITRMGKSKEEVEKSTI